MPRPVPKPYRVSRLKGCGRGVFELELLKRADTGFQRIATAPHASEGAIADLNALVDAANSVGPLLAALRSILPYTESRLEDMAETAEATRDLPITGPTAEADYRRCRDAFQAAQTVLASFGGGK